MKAEKGRKKVSNEEGIGQNKDKFEEEWKENSDIHK